MHIYNHKTSSKKAHKFMGFLLLVKIAAVKNVKVNYSVIDSNPDLKIKSELPL